MSPDRSVALRVTAPLSEPPSIGNFERARKPRLLDLFCGAGGAAMGYHRAGWDVTGVDIKRQPHYPFKFLNMDVFEYLDRAANLSMGFAFDAIHASPPCQRFTRFQTSQPQRENRHCDLITPTRVLLEATGLPWVMENVPGSPLRDPVTVCGTAFALGVARGQLWRHRLFEGRGLIGTKHYHVGPSVMVAGHGIDGYRGNGLNAADARAAMDIDWMNRDELAEAIPPAYTEFIGAQLLAVLDRSPEVSA